MVFSLEYIISLNVCWAFNEVGKTVAVNAAIISFWPLNRESDHTGTSEYRIAKFSVIGEE